MRGLFEFTKPDLIANQLLIAETFETLHKITSNDPECLNHQKADYARNSSEALRFLWYLFEDNNLLLIEADLKEDIYYKENIFKKAKEQYLAALNALYKLKRTTTEEQSGPSARDELISKQMIYFTNLQDLIKNTNIDDLNKQHLMEECQQRLHTLWNPIENGHLAIRKEFADSLPDVTYELNYVQYKNMYETTLSLLNYKIDIVCQPLYRIIPHIGIPTWRMFDNYSEVPAFSVNSVVWEKFGGLGDLIRNNKISEGDKRQLLIRTFLSYQTPVDHNPDNQDADDAVSSDMPEEPTVFASNFNEVD